MGTAASIEKLKSHHHRRKLSRKKKRIVNNQSQSSTHGHHIERNILPGFGGMMNNRKVKTPIFHRPVHDN